MSRCPKADALRISWYMTKSELDRYLLESHLRTCDKCRNEMSDLTAQAKRAEMPSLDDKAMEEE